MNRKLRSVLFVTALSLTLIAWCVPSLGQVLKGSISGTVLDPQGAVVAGAAVTAKSLETGTVFTTTTDSSGGFRINLVPTGSYNVDIKMQGFKTAQSKALAVNAGSDASIGKIRMVVGAVDTTLEVTGTAAPLVETTQAQISSTFSGTELNSFAGIQENEGLDRLALFVPGVVNTRDQTFSNSNGVGFSSNGLRGRNNDQEIDGQNNNDNSVGGPGLFLSNTEFVGQYVIITNNFGPEYGRNAGSVVNVITKSGTNNWHGVVFGQDASNFLQALSNAQKQPPALTGPPRSNEEFSGGAIGGPVIKNKDFIFGGFDSDLFSGNSVFVGGNPTPTPAGLATLAACPSVNAKDLNILNQFGAYAFKFGNPTPAHTFNTTLGGCANVQEGTVNRTLATPFHGFDFVLRNDINLKSDSITARYLFNRGNSFNNGDNPSGGWFYNVPALSQAMLVSWTHTLSSHMVNEFRVSFSRINVDFGGGLNPLEPPSGGLPLAFTNISFQNPGAGGFDLGIGPATNLPQGRIVNTWQAQDNWNWVLGKHTLKAGVNWTYQRSPNIFLPVLNGQFRYSTLSSFLANSSATPNRVQIASGNPSLDFREKDTFLYFGDDWKLGSNLTLNLGITWTYYGQPANLFNQITTARESNAATALWLQTLPLSVRTEPLVPSIKNSFGPSIGFAWQPQWGGFITGHGKTTVRGGYRLLYDPPYYNIFVNISSSAPEVFLQSITQASCGGCLNSGTIPANPSGPNVRAALAGFITKNTFDPRTFNETTVTPTFGPDKVNTWSLGFERELTKNAAFEARYVGNHAWNLYQTNDANPFSAGQKANGLLPASTPSCAVTAQSGPGAGTDLGRLVCGPGVGRVRANTAFSDYNALQTEFRATNLFKQMTVRAGYTWSKALDNVSEIFSTFGAGNSVAFAQNPFATGGAERSNSGLSVPNTFTFIVVEQLPFFKQQHGLAGHVLGGWTISADYVLASGQPYTPIQVFEAGAFTNFNNPYDQAFVNAFGGGVEFARPFLGTLSAPANQVGIFAGDACNIFGLGCALLPTTLLSENAAEGQGTVVTVSKSQVRYITNSATAQTVFGTPFGNAARNLSRDARSNLLNATIYKNIRLGEKANLVLNLTANNALNHFNFNSVDPFLLDVGDNRFGDDFGVPSHSDAAGRRVWVGAKISF